MRSTLRYERATTKLLLIHIGELLFAKGNPIHNIATENTLHSSIHFSQPFQVTKQRLAAVAALSKDLSIIKDWAGKNPAQVLFVYQSVKVIIRSNSIGIRILLSYVVHCSSNYTRAAWPVQNRAIHFTVSLKQLLAQLILNGKKEWSTCNNQIGA